MGNLVNLQGEPSLKQIKFRLISVGLDVVTNTIHSSGSISVPVNPDGTFEVELWCNAYSLTETRYRCVLPGNGDFFEFNLPVGTTDINISDLVETHG